MNTVNPQRCMRLHKPGEEHRSECYDKIIDGWMDPIPCDPPYRPMSEVEKDHTELTKEELKTRCALTREDILTLIHGYEKAVEFGYRGAYVPKRTIELQIKLEYWSRKLCEVPYVPSKEDL